VIANVHPAPLELADLAVKMRPDWDRVQLDGAIAQARSSGWSFPRVFSEVARLLVLADSSPRDLTAASRNPALTPLAPSDPELAAGWAEVIREAWAVRRGAA
jgi:hypothetical protein